MRMTKTTIAVLVLCFFTVQLKAEQDEKAQNSKALLDVPDLSEVLEPGSIKSAFELLFQDLFETRAVTKPVGAKTAHQHGKPALRIDVKKTEQVPASQPVVKPAIQRRKTPAPIVNPSKFRFGVSDREV